MKKEVLIIKDRLAVITDADLKTIKEQTATDKVTICDIEDKTVINNKYTAVVAYNNCLFFIKQILNNDLLSIIDKIDKKFIYRRDNHFIGIEAISNITYSYKVIYPKYAKRILICVPTYQYCTTETMQSVYDLIVPDNVIIDLMFVTGYTVVQARNRAVIESLAGEFDYTFFVDSDIVLPRYILYNLININADITTGYYLKKTKEKNITELYGPDKISQNNMVNILKEELPGQPFNVLACGFGCTLVKNQVFKAIQDTSTGEYFKYIETTATKCSEDIYLCIKAAQNNFKIIADPRSFCMHVGKAIY